MRPWFSLLFLSLLALAGGAGWFMFGKVIPSEQQTGMVYDAFISETEEISQFDSLSEEVSEEVSENSIRVAAILIRFSDTDETLVSSGKAREAIFTHASSARAYYNEISEGRMYLEGYLDPENGDIFGPYTVPRGSSLYCNTGIWRPLGEQAAASDGFSRSHYDKILYFFPGSVFSDCSSVGMASAVPGGNASYYFIPASYTTVQFAGYITHELGHNFGLLHANALVCRNENNQPVSVSRSGVCSNVEYGDRFDLMGLGAGSVVKPYFNVHFRTIIGALEESSIQTVTESGIYSIAPAELSSPSLPRGLKIELPTPLSNGARSYVIEYRRRIGFDAYFNQNHINGVMIRAVDNSGANPTFPASWIIDASPETTSAFDKVLGVDKIFVDSEAYISIRTLSISSTEARVEIRLNESVPNLPPTVAITAPLSGTLYANTPITIKASAFDQDGRVALVDFYNGTVRLFKDTTPPYEVVWRNPPLGTNMLIAKARDNEGMVTDSAPVLVKILPPRADEVTEDNAPPVVYLLSSDADPLYASGETVSVYATASDDVGIARVELLVNSVDRVATDTTAPYQFAWNTSGRTPGRYRLTAVAYDTSGKKNTHSIYIEIVSGN